MIFGNLIIIIGLQETKFYAFAVRLYEANSSFLPQPEDLPDEVFKCYQIRQPKFI